MKFENFKKIILGVGALGATTAANAKSESGAEKVFTDSTKNTSIEDPVHTLKPGEKFKEIPVIQKEVAGITVDGMILIPIASDTTKDYVLVKFSGEGENLLGKMLSGLKIMGYEPASSEHLSEINDEAFRKAGKSVMALDNIHIEIENLGQNEYMPVGENETVDILNSLKKQQTTEVGAMTKYGTTTDYAVLACKDKKKDNTVNYADFTSKNK